jgi:hypothetical protein
MMKKILIMFVLIALVLMIGCKQKEPEPIVVGEWCAEGSTWNSSGEGVSATMVVQGIEAFGKYSGFCHATYDIETPEGKAKIDIYYDQAGNGYQVVESNGQIIESEWSGN